MKIREKSRQGEESRREDLIHLGRKEIKITKVSGVPYSYLFLNCLKVQTTEKYLSKVREMVMYTLAVMLVWNRELKEMN